MKVKCSGYVSRKQFEEKKLKIAKIFDEVLDCSHPPIIHGITEREDIIKLINELKKIGFIKVDDFENDTHSESYYGLLYQSHKKRINYEFCLRVKKYKNKQNNGRYHYCLSSKGVYPKSYTRKMDEKITFYLHYFCEKPIY